MIEMGKKYMTSSGEPVRILCVDGPAVKTPVVGFIEGHDYPTQWTLNGAFNDNGTLSGTDLVESDL